MLPPSPAHASSRQSIFGGPPSKRSLAVFPGRFRLPPRTSPCRILSCSSWSSPSAPSDTPAWLASRSKPSSALSRNSSPSASPHNPLPDPPRGLSLAHGFDYTRPRRVVHPASSGPCWFARASNHQVLQIHTD